MDIRPITNEDLRDLIDRNHDDATAQFRQISQRVHALEQHEPGHTDDEIIEMVDNRLAHFADSILPNVIRKAITNELRAPLKHLEENSDRNHKAIERLVTSTAPVVDFCETVSHLRRAVLWIGGPAAVIVTLAGLLTLFGWLS